MSVVIVNYDMDDVGTSNDRQRWLW